MERATVDFIEILIIFEDGIDLLLYLMLLFRSKFPPEDESFAAVLFMLILLRLAEILWCVLTHNLYVHILSYLLASNGV